MLFSSIFKTALSVLLISPLSFTHAIPTESTPSPEGSLSLISTAEALTFSYSTTDPARNNWIGIYHASGGGPIEEQYVSNSLAWAYVPNASGTVRVDVSNLEPGEYIAFFLAKDGYKWLASPIFVSIQPQGGEGFAFIVDSVTLHNARQGDDYTAKIAGLAKVGYAPTFEKISGDGWVQVSTAGVITGVPDRARDSVVTVRATIPVTGHSSTLNVKIPVRRSGSSALVPELKVMTFNLWWGGTYVNDYHNKQVKFIVSQNVDIIGLQEAHGGHVKRLADALGWYYWQPSASDLGIISRYPIVQVYGLVNASGGVRVALDGEAAQVNFWNMHLGYTPYGPYDFCFTNMSVATVLQREAQSGRTPQIVDTLAAMAPHIRDSRLATTFLVGDANAPSHLDWTPSMKTKNCGYSNVPWPTSIKPIEAGLIDSFRVANPDPLEVPGVTWSPLYPFHNGGSGQVEPQDRIDFIYHAGKVQVLESKAVVVGTPSVYGQHQENEWTSDHAVVVTTYRMF
ncbi:hypothetical protein TWF718_003440 [Orbilia javanica]|uniref:Endonuclease/exonuclease/phosphatase domain-containing protein n=1 Tax=Orbilia javanica TaxID=47235 RepID=A0AAN8R7X1_9PEZI